MLEDKDVDRLEERFLTRREFSQYLEKQAEAGERNERRMTAMETQLKMIIWLLTAVCGGVIGIFLKISIGGGV